MLLFSLEPEFDALKDIRMPAPVSGTPQTYGWWLLAALVVALGIALGLMLRRRHRANAYRRRALALLGVLETQAAAPSESRSALMRLPVLLKRTALQAWPREEVAALSGDAWLAFLDASYGGAGFVQGPGRPVAALSVADVPLSAAERQALFAEVRRWIGGHRA